MIELSIIVPVFNEAATLSALFETLSRQEQIAFELILADGGSGDGTAALAAALADEVSFSCQIIQSAKGRARQLNAGARKAGSEILLFLHADSAFPDPLALRSGLDALKAVLARREDGRVAGRFALRFAVPPGRYGFGYYFYETKARLGRPGGIHGDQGFLLPRLFFEELGGYDESLGLLEDNRLAESVRRVGEWRLLPAEIVTSARRFECEGLAERQVLNALLMNFAAIGWDDFARRAPDVYRSQGEARRLQLLPFFRAIDELLAPLPRRRRRQLWYATGTYVRSQAWQAALAIDARRNFRRGAAPGSGLTPFLVLHDRWFDRLTDHVAGRGLATLGVWIWFRIMGWRLRSG